jgi:isopentenyl-diphosphate Delta-isomerase
MPEIIDIINMNDQVIGQATREDVYAKNHMHRIVHIIVRDSAGRFLLQIRSATVKYRPLHWSTAAGGHVQTGETYEQAARRELEEEIGITQGELREVGKFFYQPSDLPKYLWVFEFITDADVALGEEVASTQFFTPEEAHELITTHDKIHPELKFLWEKIYDLRRDD